MRMDTRVQRAPKSSTLQKILFNKMLSSDCLNTNLRLDNVWLVGSNVSYENLMSGW